MLLSGPLVIGVDCGTTACKAIAWSQRGHPVARGRAVYPLLQPTPNWYEQVAGNWWRGAYSAISETLDQIDVSRVEALCITHQRESFVPVGRGGQGVVVLERVPEGVVEGVEDDDGGQDRSVRLARHRGGRHAGIPVRDVSRRGHRTFRVSRPHSRENVAQRVAERTTESPRAGNPEAA